MVLTHQFVGASILLLDTNDFVAQAGAGDSVSEVAVMVAAAHFIGSIVGLFVTDSINRRTQLLTGLSGLSVIGILLCALYASDAGLVGTGACLYIYVATFQCFFSPMFYCVVTEIFPVDLRAIAIAVTFSSLFFLTFLVSLFYGALRKQTFIDGMNNEAAWSLFFGFSAFISWCTLRDEKILPETRGISLFDSSSLWGDGSGGMAGGGAGGAGLPPRPGLAGQGGTRGVK